MSLKSVIEAAKDEPGRTEHPSGSNHVIYWNEYDERMQGQPWCCSGLWWVFKRAGKKTAFFGGAKTANCTTLYRWYKAQGLTVPKNEVKAGGYSDPQLQRDFGNAALWACG